jgi:hypothetical protein
MDVRSIRYHKHNGLQTYEPRCPVVGQPSSRNKKLDIEKQKGAKNVA